MTENEIQELFQHGKLPNEQVGLELIQTHISWVILCKNYVYKIKKPLNLSFLDFSTLEKRKHFCEQELMLNQRLTHDVYLRVLPVYVDGGEFTVGSETGVIVDYVVEMRRLNNSREMSTLLKKGDVEISDIQNIVIQLATFHQNTTLVKGNLTADLLIDDFKDIQQIQHFIEENIGTDARDKLAHIISFTEQFIRDKSKLITQRDSDGFTRDCHGDLHSGNIFLLEKPVLFDCIEFNDHFRQIDILSELAFFAMDLEFAQRSDLSDFLIKSYNNEFEVIRNEEEEQLFLFYKLYRANVKVKVNAIKTMQASDPETRQTRLDLFKNYFLLFFTYYKKLLAFTKQQDSASHMN